MSDRQVIDGIVDKIRTGISWRDLPERYGPWQTVSPASAVMPWTACSSGPAADPSPRKCGRRHRLAGTDRLHHRPRSSARHQRQDEPDEHALGRSSGGLTTKIRPRLWTVAAGLSRSW
ncbi:transposase [Streptomyces chartreusis]